MALAVVSVMLLGGCALTKYGAQKSNDYASLFGAVLWFSGMLFAGLIVGSLL